MIDTHEATNFQHPPTIFVKNTFKKTQISCSPYSALKLPKVLKNSKKTK